jgi:drug/metabolite transporter (DMT)-like permease
VVGVLLALAAAATFGVLTPAAKAALVSVGAMRGAGLAYLAAGTVALGARMVRRFAPGPPIGRAWSKNDVPRLLGMTLFGGVLGPSLFFVGVSRVAAHQAAVVQHLEFALTVLLAVIVLGERPGRRGILGLLLVGIGVVLLSILGFETPERMEASATGMALIVAACATWAVDNTLARGASELDPLVVVAFKGLAAGAVLILVSWGDGWPLHPGAWGLLFLAGGVGVGVSLVLELLALRRIGAALNAGLFATGPAFGFLWSLAFLGERSGAAGWAALACCAAGALVLAVDVHGHAHVHLPIRHTHRHDHRDGHHVHAHGSGVDVSDEHVHEHEHEHEHERLRHAHDHVHDVHHRHRH